MDSTGCASVGGRTRRGTILGLAPPPTAPRGARGVPAPARASARRPRASACRPTAGGARRACAARRSPSSPGSGCPGTRGSSRAATSRRRRACSTRSPASSTSTPPSARTSSTSPASPLPPPRGRLPDARRRPSSPQSSSALEPNPAYLLGPRTDVLAWNRAATRLLGAPTRAPDGTANLLWWLFTDPGAGGPTAPGDRPQHARPLPRRARAPLRRPRLRRAHRRAARGQPEPSASCGRATRCSTRSSGRRRSSTRELGPLVLHHLQTAPTSHPDLRLTQFAPGDARTRALLGGWSTSTSSVIGFVSRVRAA